MTDHPSHDISYFPELSTVTQGFDPDVMWTPFIDLHDGRVGYRVQTEGTTDVTFIYLNPSSGTDSLPNEGEPPIAADVFVYEGPHNDPCDDVPHHYYTPDFDLARKILSESQS